MSDEPTLRTLTGLLGDRQAAQTSTSIGSDGRRSTSTSTTFRPLAGADELRQIPADHGVLVYGAHPPARIALRPYYRNRHLHRVVKKLTAEVRR